MPSGIALNCPENQSISIAISCSRRAQGTFEEGPEACGSLKDKGGAISLVPGGHSAPFYYLHLQSELFLKAWLLVREPLSIWLEKLSQIHHAEGGSSCLGK